MTGQQDTASASTEQERLSVLAIDDERFFEVAARIRERVHRKIYVREREHYPEWVDLGGEGGAV